MDFNRGDTPLMFAFSMLSIVTVLPMILSFVIFSHIRKKQYMRVVLYLAISNLLNNIGSLPGQPVNNSFACWFSALITNIFTLASVFWSLVITFMIHRIVFTSKIPAVDWKYHALCWGLPCVVTFLAFINATYGAPDGLGWCWVVPTASTPPWGLIFWYWETFYFWLTLGIFAMMMMCAHVIYHIKYLHSATQEKLMQIINSVKYYPIILAVCWSGQLVYDNVSAYTTFPGMDVVGQFSLTIACAQGFFTSTLFFSSNGDVRKCWYEFLTTGTYTDTIEESHRRDSILRSQGSRTKRNSLVSEVGTSAKVHVTDTPIRQSETNQSTKTSTRDEAVEIFANVDQDEHDDIEYSVDAKSVAVAKTKVAFELLHVEPTEDDVVNFETEGLVICGADELGSGRLMMKRVVLPSPGGPGHKLSAEEAYIVHDV